MKSELIFGDYECNFGIQECTNEIIRWIKTGNSLKHLTCLNANSFIISKYNLLYRNALIHSDWVIPDGVGILLASYILNGKKQKRITGSDIFRQVNNQLNYIGGSVFLLGSTNQTLKKMVKRLKLDYPNVKISGVYSPPFKLSFTRDDIDKMIAEVNNTSSDILWVGMTSPKQDVLINKCRNRFNVKFAAGVGAVFDFYSGNISRAPVFMQKIGLEWLHRFIKSPKRMFKRNMISGSLFLFEIIKFKLKSLGK